MCCPKAFAPEPRKPRLQPTIQVTRCRHQLPTTSFLGSKGWCQVVQSNFEAPDRPTNHQERATNQPKQPPNNKGVASQRGFSEEKCHFDAPPAPFRGTHETQFANASTGQVLSSRSCLYARTQTSRGQGRGGINDM